MTLRCAPLRCEWVKEQCCHDRPDTAERQSKQGLYHRRDAEFAEFGIFLDQEFFYSAPSAPPR